MPWLPLLVLGSLALPSQDHRDRILHYLRSEERTCPDRHLRLSEHFGLITSFQDEPWQADLGERLEALFWQLKRELPVNLLEVPEPFFSAVRICEDRDEYFQYGGPGGSSAYSNPAEGEIATYRDVRSPRQTLEALQSMLALQYLDGHWGRVTQRPVGDPWYRRGLMLCYGELVWREGHFEREPPPKRLADVRELVTEGRFLPLADLLSLSEVQFMGGLGIPSTDLQLQAWVLVRFLREDGATWPGYDPRWRAFRRRYEEAAVMTTERPPERGRVLAHALDGATVAELERDVGMYVRWILDPPR